MEQVGKLSQTNRAAT